jgi:hypothetical protein
MLNGHAYSRTVRAHILTNLILAGIIVDEVDLTGKERAETRISYVRGRGLSSCL